MGKQKALKPDFIYMDEPEGGGIPVGINTHSMIKTMRRCPKQTYYKYIERLRPKYLSKPLQRGTWMHSLLEYFHSDLDWKSKHDELSKEFAGLMDEEKEHLGDLPNECLALMKSYIWHYANDPWTVHETEMVLECELPDGSLYRGKIDMLVENQFGLWIVDHKTLKRIPDLSFRILDAQSALYVWAALKIKIPIQGFIWNYLRTKTPTVPQLLKDGSRLSQRAIDTDYYTYAKALKEYQKGGLDIRPYRQKLEYLKSLRYVQGAPQSSPFFQRQILEKSPAMLQQVAQEAYHTTRRMNSYPWDKPQMVERVPDRSCSFSCSYMDLCTMELFGGNTANLRRQRYTVGDPNYYYKDDKMPDKGE